MSTIVTLYSILLTVGFYYLSRIVAKKYPSPFTTPVFFSTTLIIIALLLSGLNFDDYQPAKEIMTFLLGPATVALAIPLYKNRQILLENGIPAFLGIIVGSLSTMISAVLLAKLFQLSQIIAISISVKSVTVPIAVGVSEIIGGDPALSAAFVVATGISGTMIGPWLMDKLGIENALARGLALGTISHGQGTAQASVEGELQGAIAGVAMGVSAIFVSFLAPIIVPLLV